MTDLYAVGDPDDAKKGPGERLEEPALAPPRGLGTSGRALWHDLTDVYTFTAAELALVTEACRVKDRLDLLAEVVDEEGLTALTHRGETKVHPALSEARAQEITLARLIASLRLPDADGNVPQRRGSARGTYLGRRSYGSHTVARG